MGTCEQSEVIEASSSKARNAEESLDQGGQTMEQQKVEFPDMPEWDGDRYTGIGLKKMKGYKCDLPIDELNKKRDEFWDLRNSRETENYKIWRAINQACVYDELRANMLLEELCSKKVFLAAREREIIGGPSADSGRTSKDKQAPQEIMVAGSRLKVVKAR